MLEVQRYDLLEKFSPYKCVYVLSGEVFSYDPEEDDDHSYNSSSDFYPTYTKNFVILRLKHRVFFFNKS